MNTQTTQTAKEAQALALDAELRAAEATTQDERENWLRIASEWWQTVCDLEA